MDHYGTSTYPDPKHIPQKPRAKWSFSDRRLPTPVGSSRNAPTSSCKKQTDTRAPRPYRVILQSAEQIFGPRRHLRANPFIHEALCALKDRIGILTPKTLSAFSVEYEPLCVSKSRSSIRTPNTTSTVSVVRDAFCTSKYRICIQTPKTPSDEPFIRWPLYALATE